MKKLSILVLTLLLTGCTYSISQIHTEGSASDVIDENQTPSATVTTTVPVSAIP